MVPVTVEVRMERLAEEEQEARTEAQSAVTVRSLRGAEEMILRSPTGAPGEGRPALLLKEIGGGRATGMVIGPIEATSIAMAQQGVQTDRPMTHDLLRDVVAAMGEAREVRITALREGTFFAELVVVDGGGTERTIPCRPSDGIALAVRADIPILLEESLFTWPPK